MSHGQGIMVQSLAEQEIFLFSKTDCLWHPNSLPSSYSGNCVKLTTHLHLVPGLRMSGAIPLLHPYSYKAQAGTILPFLLFTSLYIYNLFACNHFVISYSTVEPWQNDISEMASLIFQPQTCSTHARPQANRYVVGQTVS
jgi:hypothetical protein